MCGTCVVCECVWVSVSACVTRDDDSEHAVAVDICSGRNGCVTCACWAERKADGVTLWYEQRCSGEAKCVRGWLLVDVQASATHTIVNAPRAQRATTAPTTSGRYVCVGAV